MHTGGKLLKVFLTRKYPNEFRANTFFENIIFPT